MGHYLVSEKDGQVYFNPTIKRSTLRRDYERTTPIRPMVAGKRRRTWQKKPKPPERVWRELGGYTTDGVTPPGNYRLVRYTEKRPLRRKSKGWFRRELGVEAEGAPEHGLRRWARNLIDRGEFAWELEEVDVGEVPAGYRWGEWRSELFVKGREPYVW